MAVPDPKKVLIIQTSFLGDIILATALVASIKDKFPNAAVDFLLRKGNEGALEGNTQLRNVWVWDKNGAKWGSWWQLLGLVRKQQYSLVINLQRFGSTGLFTALSGAKETRGFSKNPFSFLFTKSFPHDIGNGVHEVNRNFQILEGLDCKLTNPIIFTEQCKPEKSYITISPGSVWATKRMPKEKWIALLQQLPANLQIQVLGASSEANLCQEIIEQSGREAINQAGKLSIRESAGIMAGAVLNYVNDSAPMHIASAVNAPTCGIFCSTIPAFGFGPLAEFSRVVEVKNLTCKPCGLHGKKECPLGHFHCGTQIPVQDLLNVLSEALSYAKNKASIG